eukprot:151240_1
MNMDFKDRDNDGGNTSQSSQASLTALFRGLSSNNNGQNVNSDVYSDEYSDTSSHNRKRKINKRNKRSSNHFQGRPHRKKRRQNNELPIFMMDIYTQLINRPPTKTTTITVESGAQYCESGAQYFNHIENYNPNEAPKLSPPPPPAPYSTGCASCDKKMQFLNRPGATLNQKKMIGHGFNLHGNGAWEFHIVNEKTKEIKTFMVNFGKKYPQTGFDPAFIYWEGQCRPVMFEYYQNIQSIKSNKNNKIKMVKGDNDINESLNGSNNFNNNNNNDIKLNNNNNNASNDDCNDRKYFYQNLNGQKSLQNSESYIYSDYADKKDNEYKIIVSDEKNNNRIDNNDKKSGNKNIRYRNKLKTLTGKHLGAINDENSNNNNKKRKRYEMESDDTFGTDIEILNENNVNKKRKICNVMTGILSSDDDIDIINNNNNNYDNSNDNDKALYVQKEYNEENALTKALQESN